MTHTILIIDDEPMNVDILEEDLQDVGYKTLSAEDGVKGLEVLKEHGGEISVILLDRMMPNMNGMEVLENIKKDKGLKDIPVIMQTAASSSKDIMEGVKAGVFYYLTKPFNKEVMLSIVESAIHDSENRKTLLKEFSEQRRALGLMEYSQFSFGTVEEAKNLSYFLSNGFSDAERVVTGLFEIMVNAIEHGNLGITFEEKRKLILDGALGKEIKKREKEFSNKKAKVSFERKDGEVVLTIEDEGNGFSFKDYLKLSSERVNDPNGRGILIAKELSFDEMEYIPPGNKVICKVKNN